jgi:two-component system nitrogen regulation sensor histidine kinase NtrY
MPMPGTLTLRIEDVTKYEHLARIESWAPVAQKLAHGMKTPLMNLQLGIQQVESGCHQIDSKTQGIIENINAEIDRLRKLTDNFMKFTQLTPPTLTSENINEILKDLVNRYSLTFPAEIKIQLNLNQELPKTMLDRREIENAFTIVFYNAIEAMKKTGILSIATSLQQHFEKKIKNTIQIIIADTGKGIPERYVKDLFTPYFVYEKPQGTGLGLPLAKKIIEDHKGTIEIKSKEGIGTTVIINLPVIS